MKNRDLKEFRERNGISQRQFAEKLRFSQPTISKAESKPEQLVSNKIYRRFHEAFRTDQNNNLDDPEVNIEFSVKMKKSQLTEMTHKKAVIDLTQFFTLT